VIETTTAEALRAEIAAQRGGGKRIAFVPTMGNLHVGHRCLMDAARKLADVVVVSIYVNPLQFGPKEDFGAYPRTPAEDRALASDAKVDLLFVPSEAEMYPRGREWQTQVEVPRLSDILCGAFRPGHFRGVTTVVARLFNLVTPDLAVFGKKDFQQLLLIRHMVADLAMRLEIVGIDTVREHDGLAVSSRNRYLTDDERKIAPKLQATLRRVSHVMQVGTPVAQAEAAARAELESAGFRPDYISVRRPNDLGEPQPGDRSLIVVAAAWLGRTRLIDNLEFEI
jgi:pantoate--beta-alanine ligase